MLQYQLVWTVWQPETAIWKPLEGSFGYSMARLVMDGRDNFDDRLPHTARVQTGELKRSIKTEPTGRFSALFKAAKKYAMAQEVGSRPHTIRAKNAPNLVFPWEGNERGLFVGPRVSHPGTKGTNSMRDAAAAWIVKWPQLARMWFR